MSFENIFKASDMDAVKSHIALGQFYLITAGEPDDYNIMCGSTPGFNIFLHKNCFSLLVAETRYTLEYIKSRKSYTVSFFDSEDAQVVKTMGFQSGRGTEKVKELPFETIVTPSGNIAYKNAKLVLDLKLLALTQLTPENIMVEAEAAKFAEKKGFYSYNNLCIGEIAGAWVKA